METDPRDNRPVVEGAKKEPTVTQDDRVKIAAAEGHREAIESPAGKVFIAETLVALEKTFNEIINVDATRPDLTVTFFIGLVMKCQSYLEILKKFGFVMNYGKGLAERQVNRSMRS